MSLQTIKAFAVCAFLTVPGSAHAQTEVASESPRSERRFVVFANGGVQAASRTLNDTFRFRAYGEEAQLASSQDISGGAMFDFGGALRVWRALSIGGSYTRLATTDITEVTGAVPHPMHFNQDRSIAPQSLSLDYVEQAGHVFGAWRLPLSEKMDLSVFGGMSLYNLTSGLVTNVRLSEAGDSPSGNVNVDQVQTGTHKRNGAGGHVGIDVTYMMTTSFGVGVLARLGSGSVKLPAVDGKVRPVAVGGVQIGGGVRVRF